MIEKVKERFQEFKSPYGAIAIIYFFFNSLFLPQGLLYTTLLTPVFLWWIWSEKPIRPFLFFIVITEAFAVIHLFSGVHLQYYFRSWALAFCSFVFAITLHVFFRRNTNPGRLFESIAMVNLFLISVAIAVLFIPPLNEYFWYYLPISPGVQSFPRLKMLTYEASYYALVMAPIFIYLLIKVIFNKTTYPVLVLAMVVIPIILSLSFGVIMALGISIAVVFIWQFKSIVDSNRKRRWFILSVVCLILIGMVVLFVFPENPVAKRVFNILSNKDTSMQGRTSGAFNVAWMIASEKSKLFGVGFGQIKVLGHQIIVNYYKYYEAVTVVRIPNTLGETLAMFGIIGLIFRFAVEIFLFFKTKVYTNVFRFAIFLFVFIYQFTGSFLFNAAELTLWVIAFTPLFPQFNVPVLKGKTEI